jgi:hypothetical protein
MSAALFLGSFCFSTAAGTRRIITTTLDDDDEWLETEDTEGGNVPPDFTQIDELLGEIDAALGDMEVYTPPTDLPLWKDLLEALAFGANGLATVARAMVVSPLMKTRNLMQVVLATGIVTCVVVATMRKK